MKSLHDTVSEYADRSLSPVTVVQQCQRAIRERNPEINAIVHADDGGALRAAQASSKRWIEGTPLSAVDGASIVVKANIAVAGMPWTAALACFSRRLASQDSLVVARLRRAGAVILGISNMDEGALGATTASEFYGACHNPLRLGFTPGGSSGGSAAAVAAGFCLGAIGTDTMGSIRIPAAYCGVVGFKPGYSCLPTGGVEPLCPALDHIGILARHVADVRLLHECLASDACNVTLAPAVLPRGLRIGICTSGYASQIDPAIEESLQQAGDLLQAHGAVLAQVVLVIEALEATRRAAFLLCERDLSVSLAGVLDQDKLSSTMRAMLEFGARASEERLIDATQVIDQAREKAFRLFADLDALVMPTTPHGAFPHQTLPPSNQADFAVVANAAGLPALVIPAGVDARGMPVSLQIVARAGEEQLALQLGEALEGFADRGM